MEIKMLLDRDRLASRLLLLFLLFLLTVILIIF